MGNCLVTKLKSVVDNDNLEELGCLRVEAKANSSTITNNLFNFNPSTAGYTVTYECIDGTNCLCYSDGVLKNKIVQTQNMQVFITNTEYKKFRIINKYDINRIDVGKSTNFKINLNDVKYSKNLQKINVYPTAYNPGFITGNINDVIKGHNPWAIYLMHTDIYCDFSDLGNYYPILTTVQIEDNGKLTGTVQGFVRNARLKSETGSLSCNYGNVFLDSGEKLEFLGNGVIEWTENTIDVKNLSAHQNVHLDE